MNDKEKGRKAGRYQLTKPKKSHKIHIERIFLNDSSEAIYSPVIFEVKPFYQRFPSPAWDNVQELQPNLSQSHGIEA